MDNFKRPAPGINENNINFEEVHNSELSSYLPLVFWGVIWPLLISIIGCWVFDTEWTLKAFMGIFLIHTLVIELKKI